MNSIITVNLSANSLSGDYTAFYGPYLIKGINTVYFNLQDIEEQLNPILYIDGNFGDGVSYQDSLNINADISTLNAVQITQTGKLRSIDQSFSHTYEKVGNSFVDYLTAAFNVTYSSQRRGTHCVQLIHIQDSYYNTVQQIYINSTQILPTSSNDIFAVASDKNGNMFNWYLSRSVIPDFATQLPQLSGTNVLAPNTIKNCFVLGAQQGGMLVPRLSA